MTIGVFLGFVLLGQIVSEDKLCYLENGRSSENIFVREDTSVGSVIGSLNVIGDVGKHGNVKLYLKESDSPVAIIPFSKNLSLARRVDREGIEGPSSISVHLLCEKKQQNDTIFSIPVGIRIIDTNDNAPAFLNKPYVLNISEATIVGTKLPLNIEAVDLDQPGPFSTVQFLLLSSKYAEYFEIPNRMDGVLVLKKTLDYETVQNFTVTIRAEDQGIPPLYSDSDIQVNVTDADDQNPKFVHQQYFAELPLNVFKGAKLNVFPEDIMAYDQDIGIRTPVYYSFSSGMFVHDVYEIDSVTGRMFVRGNSSENSDYPSAVLIVKATQVDNSDRYALTTVTIRRADTDALHFLHDYYSAAVLESAPVNSTLLTVSTNKPYRKIRYWLENHKGGFGVTAAGDVTLKEQLDYETIGKYQFEVFATDGYSKTKAYVNITVLNVNDWDPRFRYPHYDFFLPENYYTNKLTPGTIIGRIEVADGDKDDYIRLSLQGFHSKAFSIDDAGEITVDNDLFVDDALISLIAVATDSGIPPRQASVPVTLHLPIVSHHKAMIDLLLSKKILFFVGTTLFVCIVAILSMKRHYRTSTSVKNSITSKLYKSSGVGSGALNRAKIGNIILTLLPHGVM